jgi:hypothetical protein
MTIIPIDCFEKSYLTNLDWINLGKVIKIF